MWIIELFIPFFRVRSDYERCTSTRNYVSMYTTKAILHTIGALCMSKINYKHYLVQFFVCLKSGISNSLTCNNKIKHLLLTFISNLI